MSIKKFFIKNPAISAVLTALAFTALAFGMVVSIIYRYELGISKPKFNAGDCVRWTYNNEFDSTHFDHYILKRGKSSYLMSLIHTYKGETYATGPGDADSMERVDRWEKIECPSPLKIETQ